MPIFDYRCTACGHTFELFVQSSTVPECPKCHERHLDKLFSKFAVGGHAVTAAPPCMTGGCGAGLCGDAGGPGAGACRLDA